jgi:hypothetical protein
MVTATINVDSASAPLLVKKDDFLDLYVFWQRIEEQTGLKWKLKASHEHLRQQFADQWRSLAEEMIRQGSQKN